MKKIIFFLSFVCVFAANAVVVKPFASIFFYQDNAQNLISEGALTFFDDGNFRFQTTSGGWSLCSDQKAGAFFGNLSKEEFFALKKSIEELPKKCSSIEGCSTKRETRLGVAQYTVHIQGKKIQRFYFNDSSFRKFLPLYADKNFFERLKTNFGVKIAVENHKLYLSSLTDEKFSANLSKHLLAYDKDGNLERLELKEKTLHFGAQSIELKLNKGFSAGSRLVLPFDLVSPTKGTRHYTLCVFDK